MLQEAIGGKNPETWGAGAGGIRDCETGSKTPRHRVWTWVAWCKSTAWRGENSPDHQLKSFWSLDLPSVRPSGEAFSHSRHLLPLLFLLLLLAGSCGSRTRWLEKKLRPLWPLGSCYALRLKRSQAWRSTMVGTRRRSASHAQTKRGGILTVEPPAGTPRSREIESKRHMR